MKTIIFEGYLKNLYPNGIRLEADSPAEAILGLQNFPGFRKEDEVLHQVELPDFPSRDSIFAPTDKEEIRVVPAIAGAGGKKGGFMQIILGVVLIIAAAVILVLSGGTLGPWSIGLALAGASMLLGGIMALMMPAPKAASVVGEEKSKYIPANKNTVKVGTPIPILYGRRKVFGHFLSFDIDAKNQNEVPLPAALPPTTTAPVANAPALAVHVSSGSAINYWQNILHP